MNEEGRSICCAGAINFRLAKRMVTDEAGTGRSNGETRSDVTEKVGEGVEEGTNSPAF